MDMNTAFDPEVQRQDRPARQVIKRMAYGDRDADYFFLKIKAAFPGKAR